MQQAGNMKSNENDVENLRKRVQEQEELIQTISRAKFMWESTFDAIASPVTIISKDYEIKRANQFSAQVSNIDVRSMIGTKCYVTLAGRDSPCAHCPLQTTIENQLPHQGTLDVFPKSKKQYEVSSYPLQNMEKEWEVVLSYRDITEEKQLQKRLVHNEKMAAIGKLAGGVAHEINNPMGGILAFTQLIMRDLDDNHQAQEDLKQIENAALRCKSIVQNLLDFSRQQETDVFSPTDINQVIRRVLPLVSIQTKGDQIEIIENLDENLPFINGSVQKLEQVYLNLVTNAVQSMGGEGKLTVRTYVDHHRSKVVSEIIDTGVGIPSTNLERIFDPYFTTKQQGEGTGLGLSISYGIIQEHNGDIKVESEVGVGTKFMIEFPKIQSLP